MCGILGIVNRSAQRRHSLSDLDLAHIAHRGPDGSGVFTDEYVQLGHVRLSIIDLTDAGHQPMLSHEGRYVVTFNGEIYNYLELKAELELLGERFIGHSDTEVLLSAYKVWGTDCVKRFLGMFAFVIWDKNKHTVFLARDRCGEKPLFFYFDENRFLFGSELKAVIPLLGFTPGLNVSAVDKYLHYQYVPEPDTLLEGIHKLAAGHFMVIGLNDWKVQPKRYWNVETAGYESNFCTSGLDPLTAIRDGLEDAVKLTLRSDVPVGIALSGGVDSGAIAVLAQRNYARPMHAFCVGYPGRPKYDERAQAKALADSLGMIVHEVEIPTDNFVDFFPELVKILDEPIADPAAFGHYSVPRAAADQGIKVLLSGIGGDEIFWGYHWVTQSVRLNQLVAKYPSIQMLGWWASSETAQKFLIKVAGYPHAHKTIRHWADILQKIGDPLNADDQDIFYMLALDFRDAFYVKKAIYGPAMQHLSKQMLYRPTETQDRSIEKIPEHAIRMLFDTWLVSNCLSLGDRVSMAVGVETRMPFLDVRLIELVMSLRLQNPDHELGQKEWLRLALKGVVPDEVLKRPKAGFQPPVREWLSGVVKKYVDIIRGGQLVKSGVLSKDKIDFICTELPKQGWREMYFTYKLVLLEMWYQKIVAAS